MIVFVAVAMVVLLGMTAFVIDFGRIWQERRELQAGATAGVLAVAEDCARGLCDAAYNELATAELYADANAIDGAASVFSMDLDLADQTVGVVTATKNDTGGDTMDMLFAGIVGFDTVTVGADAAAAWGVPLNANTIPLIISDCEWMSGDPGWPAGGESLYDARDLEFLQTLTPAVITFHDPFTPLPPEPVDLCPVSPGLDLPGGFGWIDTTSGCTTDVIENDWTFVDPGNAPSQGCTPGFFEDRLLTMVEIPYFNATQGQGNTGRYRIAGHGAFVIGGYRFGGQYQGGIQGCGPPVSCLTGWFVTDVIHGGGEPGPFGGDERGLIVIKLIG